MNAPGSGQTRSFGYVGSMSGLPESGHDLKPGHELVNRVFGDGHAAAHPELVVAIVHAASSDWAARVICAAGSGLL
jgi:hypothetical protein